MKNNTLIVNLKSALFDIISFQEQQKQILKEKLATESNSFQKEKLQNSLAKQEQIMQKVILLSNNLTSELANLNEEEKPLSKKSELVETKNQPSSTESIPKQNEAVPVATKTNSKENDPSLNPKTSPSEEMPPLEEIKEQKQTSNIKLEKSTTDLPRTIIVTANQFMNLAQSKTTQKKYVFSKNLASDTKNEPQTDSIDIEKMLEEANNLYKNGQIAQSQELYEKISSINRKNQNKVLERVA